MHVQPDHSRIENGGAEWFSGSIATSNQDVVVAKKKKSFAIVSFFFFLLLLLFFELGCGAFFHGKSSLVAFVEQSRSNVRFSTGSEGHDSPAFTVDVSHGKSKVGCFNMSLF